MALIRHNEAFTGTQAELDADNPHLPPGVSAYASDTGTLRMGPGSWSSATEISAVAAGAVRPTNLGTWVRAPFTTTAGGGGPAGNATSRRVVTFPHGVVDLQVVFCNWSLRSTAPREIAAPTTLTISCSIEQTGLDPVHLTFGGKKSPTLDPWATVVSDPIGIDVAPGGTLAFRTYWTVPVPGTDEYVCNFLPLSSDTGEGHLAGDQTGNNNAVTSTVHYVFTPSGFLGNPATGGGKLSIASAGDSILAGQGESTTQGFLQLATTTTIPHQRLAIGGDMAATFVTTSQRRMGIAAGSSFVCEYGRNDCNTTDSQATIQANLVTIWNRALARRFQVWQTTITPYTSSSDSWATVENQTVTTTNSRETKRLAINAWIRDGAPLVDGVAVAAGTSVAVRAGDSDHPLTGYLEMADAVESARDSGKWKASHTGDGLHPNGTGHEAMAAAVDLTVMAAALA